MHIGLLIYGDMDSVSGGYLYNRHLVDYLQCMEDQVDIISLPHGPYWRHLADNFKRSTLARIAGLDLDILVQDELAHPSLIRLNRQLCKKALFPVVTLVHLLAAFDRHPFYSAWCYRLLERKYLQSVTGMIVNSRTTLAQASRLLGGELSSHCLAVPAGDNFGVVTIDPESINRHMTTPGPLKILVVGNIIRRKGLHVLLQAMQHLPPDNFLITVVGRTDMEPGYVQQIKRLIGQQQLQDSFIIKGPVEGQALAQLYRQHHLMVLPSAYEGYGIVYVEAQQFGLPVIGTTEGAAHEIIAQGNNGYLIAPEDSTTLAAHLKELHHNRALLKTLSDNALSAYTRHPTWDESCKIIRQYLHDRVHEHGEFK